jgi:hypothetical protein
MSELDQIMAEAARTVRAEDTQARLTMALQAIQVRTGAMQMAIDLVKGVTQPDQKWDSGQVGTATVFLAEEIYDFMTRGALPELAGTKVGLTD